MFELADVMPENLVLFFKFLTVPKRPKLAAAERAIRALYLDLLVSDYGALGSHWQPYALVTKTP